MTGYEITRTFDQVLVYFWKASHQQVYRELASLHGDGCVVYEVVRQPDKPDKKVYRHHRRGTRRAPPVGGGRYRGAPSAVQTCS